VEVGLLGDVVGWDHEREREREERRGREARLVCKQTTTTITITQKETDLLAVGLHGLGGVLELLGGRLLLRKLRLHLLDALEGLAHL
jgi:hypothetical protein